MKDASLGNSNQPLLTLSGIKPTVTHARWTEAWTRICGEKRGIFVIRCLVVDEIMHPV